MSRPAKTLAVATLLFGGLTFSLFVKLQRWERSWGTELLRVGAPAPPLELPGLEGQTVELRTTAAEHRLVVVAFWATWCRPCHKELEDLARLYEKHASEGLEILAVSIDRHEEQLERFVREEEIPFVVLLDPELEVFKRYGIRGIPTSILVGPDGSVVRVIRGRRLYLPGQIEYHMRTTRADA